MSSLKDLAQECGMTDHKTKKPKLPFPQSWAGQPQEVIEQKSGITGKKAWGRSWDKAAASNVSYAGGGTGHCDSTGISDIADIDEK